MELLKNKFKTFKARQRQVTKDKSNVDRDKRLNAQSRQD